MWVLERGGKGEGVIRKFVLSGAVKLPRVDNFDWKGLNITPREAYRRTPEGEGVDRETQGLGRL